MPRPSEIQIEKLFLGNAHGNDRIAAIYTGGCTDPERLQQKLVILIEGPRSSAFTKAIAESMIERAVKTFHATHQATPELVLESILESINVSIAELIPTKLNDVLESLSCLIALSERGQVHFSQIGEIHALLFQENTVTVVSEEPKEINPFKVFAQITSGLLNPGNTLLFTTPALIDYIAENKIKKLVNESPPAVVIEHVKELLRQAPPSTLFMSLFIKFTTELDEFSSQRHPTEYYERPQAFTSEIDDESEEPEETPRKSLRSRNRPSVQSLFIMALRGLIPFIQDFFKNSFHFFLILGRILTHIGRVVWESFSSLIYPQRRAQAESEAENFNARLSNAVRSRVRNLSKVHRAIFFTIIVLMLIIAHVLIIQSQDEKRNHETAQFDTILQEAAAKKQEVKALDIYKDDERAEQLLLEIAQLLDQLNPRSPHDKEIIAQYRAENEDDLRAIRHINILSQPLVYKDLSNDLGNSSLSSLVQTKDGKLLASGGSAVYEFNDKSVSEITRTQSSIHELTYSSESNAVYALTDDSKVFILQEKSFKPVTLPRNPENKHIDSLDLYVTNIYILDSQAQTIFKHNGNNTTYQTGAVWTKTPDLGTVNDIAIDGSIYAIKKDGSILKLGKDQVLPLSYRTLSPGLGTETQLFTKKDQRNLYILDPQHSRVVILTKEGAVVSQYIADAFMAARSLTADEKNNTLYIAADKKVYAVVINRPT